MSPNQLQFHAKREANNSLINPSSSSISPFKINKDSHAIRKSSSPSSVSSSSSTNSSLVVGGPTATATRQQRHPVIIYTHSPKIIHTNPNDFMALVQKLTGLSRSEEDDAVKKNYDIMKQENHDKTDSRSTGGVSEDNESTSTVVMDENNGSNNNNNVGDGQVNSCYAPPPHPNPNPNPMFDPQNSLLYFNQNSADFCGSVHHQQLYNYNPEALYLMPGNSMRSSFSSSTLEAMKDLPDF